MRPTLLHFRAPDERTAEFAAGSLVNRDGTFINISDQKKQNPKGSNLPKAQRFERMPFYCSGSGQSVFTGPGSYNASEAFNKITSIKTPGIMVSNRI